MASAANDPSPSLSYLYDRDYLHVEDEVVQSGIAQWLTTQIRGLCPAPDPSSPHLAILLVLSKPCRRVAQRLSQAPAPASRHLHLHPNFSVLIVLVVLPSFQDSFAVPSPFAAGIRQWLLITSEI